MISILTSNLGSRAPEMFRKEPGRRHGSGRRGLPLRPAGAGPRLTVRSGSPLVENSDQRAGRRQANRPGVSPPAHID
jgi:hypothetical protein